MTARPTDFDEHHEFRREGFYTYTAVRENAPQLRVLVTIKE